MATCMFTNTPDRHFILDLHPEFKNVVIASPCSGHGFKFASVVGEITADLAERGQTRHDIALFRLARFTDPAYAEVHGITTVQTGAAAHSPSPGGAGASELAWPGQRESAMPDLAPFWSPRGDAGQGRDVWRRRGSTRTAPASTGLPPLLRR
jgi:hypothetical protein